MRSLYMKYNVLIADDEYLVRTGIRTSLESSTLSISEIYEARNGVEALTLLKEQKVDILLTDIVMPQMDGLELVDQIREQDIECDIIILSAHSHFEYVQKALKKGVSDYLLKPDMMPDDVVRVVHESINRIEEKNTRILKPFDTALGNPLTPARQVFYCQLICRLGNTELSQLKYEIDEIYAHFKQEKTNLNTCIAISMFIYGTVMTRYLQTEIQMDNTFLQVGDFYKLIIECREIGQIENLMKEMIDNLNIRLKSHFKPVVLKAIDIINKEFTNSDFQLQNLSEMLNINVNYLSRLFKKNTGKTFTEYLIQLRIDKATWYYQNTDLRVYEISEKVGYKDWRYFSQLYKNITGHTVTQY
jgi:two-component system response regulator YesN